MSGWMYKRSVMGNLLDDEAGMEMIGSFAYSIISGPNCPHGCMSRGPWPELCGVHQGMVAPIKALPLAARF